VSGKIVLGSLEQLSQDKNLLYRHEEPNEPTKEEPFSFVLFETPFASVVQTGKLVNEYG
jgi:hypothetical protein